MTSYKTFRILIAAILISVAGGRASAAIIFSTTTDKSAYFVGETLNVLVKAENTGDQDVNFVFSDGQQADYLMDGVDLWSSHRAFIQALTAQKVPAHGSYTWTLPHLWNYYAPGPGEHSVIGKVRGYDYTAPAQFAVITPTAPLPEPVAPIMAMSLLVSTFARARRQR